MSVRVMEAVYSAHLGGGPVRKALAVALAWYARDDGSSIYPEVETLARRLDAGRATVQRQLRALEALGVLRVVARGGRGRESTTRYALDMEALDALPRSKGLTARPFKGLTASAKGLTESQKGPHCEARDVRIRYGSDARAGAACARASDPDPSTRAGSRSGPGGPRAPAPCSNPPASPRRGVAGLGSGEAGRSDGAPPAAPGPAMRPIPHDGETPEPAELPRWRAEWASRRAAMSAEEVAASKARVAALAAERRRRHEEAEAERDLAGATLQRVAS